MPQKPTLPIIVIHQIGTVERSHLRGPVGILQARVQVDATAKTLSGAYAVADAVKGDGLGADASGLFGWKGTVTDGASPSDDAEVLMVSFEGEHERYTGDELRQYTVMQDFILHWRVM